jgi:sulfur relay (sulfurtransferase) complex TusBCD TusD component (DsrE family)
MGLAAVFFHEDGVYHAQRCEGPDAESLAAGWRDLAVAASVPLLICQASVQRRLESGAFDEAFEQAGLARMLDLAIEADRVVRL